MYYGPLRTSTHRIILFIVFISHFFFFFLSRSFAHLIGVANSLKNYTRYQIMRACFFIVFSPPSTAAAAIVENPYLSGRTRFAFVVRCAVFSTSMIAKKYVFR